MADWDRMGVRESSVLGVFALPICIVGYVMVLIGTALGWLP